jgi:hypothetical protein
MLGSVNSNFVRVCGVNFQVGSFNCHSATARVDVERVEERRASDAAPHARMGFGARPNPQLARRVVWVGLVRSQLPFATTPAAGGATPVGLRIHLVSSDPLTLQGPALQWKWKRGPRRHHARDRASEARARPEPATVASSSPCARVVVALPCAARRRQSLKTTHPQLCFLSAARCGRAGRLAPRVPILGCAPHLHRGGGRASYYSLGCRRPPTLAHAPCRGDVASPSRQVASGLRAGCRRDLHACAKKLPHRRAGFYHI